MASTMLPQVRCATCHQLHPEPEVLRLPWVCPGCRGDTSPGSCRCRPPETKGAA